MFRMEALAKASSWPIDQLKIAQDRNLAWWCDLSQACAWPQRGLGERSLGQRSLGGLVNHLRAGKSME